MKMMALRDVVDVALCKVVGRPVGDETRTRSRGNENFGHSRVIGFWILNGNRCFG